MRKILLSLVISVIALSALAHKDVTQFLGIPVDGTKSEMIKKLKAKGFRINAYSYDKDILEGKFNGMDVIVSVVTNSGKVCRIMVCDANSVDERSIQIRFNNLCRQFEKNTKYMSIGYDLIPDDEKIAYEMTINNKRYEALFYQKPVELTDTTLFREGVMRVARTKYTAEEIANSTDEIKEDIENMYFEYLKGLYSMKPVWFMISDNYGKYFITMFYDNEYNRANGEEL